jgi:hypothetical protein
LPSCGEPEVSYQVHATPEHPLVPRTCVTTQRQGNVGGPGQLGPIRLTRAASPRIDRAIDQTASGQVEDHVGDLREIDLDNHSMAIRNATDVREVRCTFDESFLEAAKEALDRRVKVSGVRQPGPGRRASAILHVFRLELLDDPTSEGGPESAAGAAVAN